MATTIKIKNSATPSSTPSSLEQGEMALNVTDGKLFYGSGSGNDVKEFTGTSIDTGSFATTGSNTFIGNQIITGSVEITGSITASGNISGSQTGSFAYLQLPGFEFDSNAPSTSLEVQGPITSSAISSSGQIYGQVGANEYSTSNVASSASYSGDIIKLLSTAVTVRAVYYLNKTQWSQADNTAESTSDKLLAISVGTNSNQGMLLRGLFNLGYNPGGFPGEPVYLDATGVITATLPTTSGEVVRILGYNVDTNIIYFNPSNDYIVLV
jgi:hypothetical protein